MLLVLQFTVGSATPNQVSTTAVQLHSRFDDLNLNIRLSATEDKSRHQEHEIDVLKTLRGEDKKVINQLQDRVDQLEASMPKSTGHGSERGENSGTFSLKIR